MRRFAALLVILFAAASTFAHADGYPSVDGVTADGWNVDFDEPSVISVWRGADREHARWYKDQPCTFEQGIAAIAHPHRDTTGSLVCDASGTSPLAGTVYEMRKVAHSVCDRGDPAERLVCIKGCSAHAPRVMLRGYWEC